jgi:hypothetical protein
MWDLIALGNCLGAAVWALFSWPSVTDDRFRKSVALKLLRIDADDPALLASASGRLRIWAGL